MEIISGIPLIGGFLATLLPFVLVLGIVVFVHEYGHYIVGRWTGIKAEVFSLGFGPVLASRRDRRGTEWQIAAIPLGGFVKFLGDADGSSRADPAAMQRMNAADRAQSFHGAPLRARALTVLAGPVANFLLSILIFGGVVMASGIERNDPVVGAVRDLPGGPYELMEGDRVLEVGGEPVSDFAGIVAVAEAIKEPGPVEYLVERGTERQTVIGPFPSMAFINGIQPLSPASEAGVRPGDLIISANGQAIHAFNDLVEIVGASEGAPIDLVVWREGAALDLTVTPEVMDYQQPDGSFATGVKIGAVGRSFAAFEPAKETPAPWTALYYGARQVVGVITGSVTALGAIIGGELSATNLQGPLGIAQVMGEAAGLGIEEFIWRIGVISTAIGFLNLFPIPVLDGGHLMAFGYEALRGKPLPDRVMQVMTQIGLTLVLSLMLFATYNDIMR